MRLIPEKRIDPTNLPPVSLDRMVRAVERVRERLIRASRILTVAKIPFAVVGGNAVAAWVSRVDEAAVRNTQDVDILIRREDLESAKLAFESNGLIYGKSFGVEFFLDGPEANPRDAIHIVFADEKVKPDDLSTTPGVFEADKDGEFPVVNLEPLVRMKLTSFRDKDRTHLRDLIGIELIDDSWPKRFPGELGQRLQQLLDDPDG